MDLMDWEPEVPGQWNTPLCIRRQRAAAEAAHSNITSSAERSTPTTTDCPVDWEPEVPGQFNTPLRIRRKRAAAEAGFLETVLDSEFHTPTVVVQTTVPTSKYFASIAKILATTFLIFHQIFSATVRAASSSCDSVSAVAQSRHIVEIRRTAIDGFESVKRRVIDSGITRPVAPTSQQIIRNTRLVSHSRPPRPPRRRTGNWRMASPREPFVDRVSPPLDAPPPQKAPFEQIASPSEFSAERTWSLQVEASQPPIDREAIGAKLWASFTPRPIPGTKGLLATSQEPATLSAPLVDGEPNVPSDIETIVTMRPLNEKPAPAKHNKILSSKFDRPNKWHRAKSPLKSLLLDHESRRSSSKTHDSISHLQTRRSLPQLSSETQGSEIPRRARFAINPTNGQPQEHSVKFYKNSIVGEWAPSSPWANDQVLGCTSDLEHNLKALLTDGSWLPPPSTPILSCPKSYHLRQDSSYLPEENYVCSPQGTEPHTQLSPISMSDPSPVSKHTHSSSDQHMVDESLVRESPTSQKLGASSIKDSPYARIKELVTGSFRGVFSASPPVVPSDSIDTDTAQEAVDVSVKDHDTSLKAVELNHSSSIDDLSPVPDRNHPGLEGGMGFAPDWNKCTSGFIDRPIKIYGNDGIKDSVVDSVSNNSVEHSNGLDGSDDSHGTPRKEEDPTDTDLELAMSNLKMSKYSKEKLGRRRREREAAAAAKKAAEAMAAAKAVAEAEEAARKARFHRRTPKDKLVKPPSKDWEAKVREAMDKGDHVALTTTISGTELRRKDFVTVLGDKQWLNDEIINAYLEWIVEYANKKAGKNGRNAIPKVIAHNSFFYKNIATQGPQSVSRWMKRKKAEGKKLLDVETVLIPVNNASHWTIIVVSPKERTIEYLDSFSGPSKVFIHHTKEWLAAELGNDWREDEWRVLHTRSAKQSNGWDCGVFLVTNAECVAGGLMTDSYDGRDMAIQRRRIAAVLLNRGFGDEFVPAEDL